MQEIEAKFYVQDLKQIESRIQKLDAHLIQPRVLETNIRFDLPDGGLSSERRVLRLRQDTEARFTYKGPGMNEQGVLSRTEIEFTVSDFEMAKEFLEALGFQPIFYYEKYRTTYTLESDSLLSRTHEHTLSGTRAHGLQICHIMLDEMPYGNFVEIEGESIAQIRSMANKLNLDWQAAISKSYSRLFEIARRSLGFTFSDLTFANFEKIKVAPESIQVRPADSRHR